MHKLICGIIMQLFAVSFASGQRDTTDAVLSAGFQLHAGRLVKIHGEYPPNNISTVAEASVLWKCRGGKNWHGAHGYPSAGFSLVHAQFGNQDVLGQSVGAIPMLRHEHYFSRSFISVRAGLGLAWFNKPYDAISNPANLVIGSSFANMTLFAAEYNYCAGKHWLLKTGFSFLHCSGAHMTVPNIGANLPAFTAGICYYHNHECLEKNIPREVQKTNQKFAGLQMITGFHEFPGTVRPADGPRYIVYGLGGYAGRSFRAHQKLSVGLNAHYYTAYADYIQSQELITSNKFRRRDAMNLVSYVGYEWTYGRFAFFVQAGINLYDPALRALNEVWDLPKHGWLHQYTANKIGYRMYAQPQFGATTKLMQPYLQMAVKTNGGTADFLELAIGVDFSTRVNRRHE
jgi:hypothetical protein